MAPQIEIITGPMFAGKTTMLTKRIREDKFPDNSKLLFNFAGDKRYTSDANIASHNKDIVPSINSWNDFFAIPEKHNGKITMLDDPRDYRSGPHSVRQHRKHYRASRDGSGRSIYFSKYR